MSRYRKVDQRMWADAKFRKLSIKAKLLWVYFLTGPEATALPGFLCCGKYHLAEALGWDVADVDAASQEIESHGMARYDWDARFVWILNSLSYNRPTSSKSILGWKPHWDLIPECELKAEATRALESDLNSIGMQFSFASAQEQEQEQEKEQEQEQDRQNILTVFRHWQCVMKTTAKLDDKRSKRIGSRLHEGFTAEDLCKAISGAAKDPFIMGTDPKSRTGGYKGIETVLRDAAQVERFLALADSKDECYLPELKSPKADKQLSLAEILAGAPQEAQEAIGSLLGGAK